MSKSLLAAAILAFTGAAGICAQDLESKPRLTRPASHSADGKLYEGSTVGNLVVATLGDVNRRIRATKEPKTAQILADYFYCKSGATSEIYATSVKQMLKKTAKTEKLLLRAGDPAAMRGLAIAAIGFLDNVNAQAIAEDEALGPGVYHDSIVGMEQALQICHFYGHLR